MSTAVDFERKAELVVTKTVQTHLAARGVSSVYLRPAVVHRGGQLTHEQALMKISQPMEEIGGQALHPKSLKLLWEVTISKEVWKEPLSIIQRKRQPNWRLRRGGRQVSGGGQFTQCVASSTLGRLEYNLRFASFQCAMPKNRRNQFRRTLVIDGICNKTTIPLVQSAEIEQSC